MPNNPIDGMKTPKLISRIASAAVDAAMFAVLSFLLIGLFSFILTRDGAPIKNENTYQSKHIESSKLSKWDEKNGYVKMTSDDFFVYEDGSFRIINDLWYFYGSYLTGENLNEGLIASEYATDEKYYPVVDSSRVAPKDYYTIDWFNTNILGLPSQESGDKEGRFFTYLEKDGSIDYTKPGFLKSEFYIEKVVGGETTYQIINGAELSSYMDGRYNEAVKFFYNQEFLKASSKKITMINSFLLLGSLLISAAVFYLIIPMCSPLGKTLGKRFFYLILVDDKGYLVKKYQILLRVIPLLSVIIIVSFINSLIWQLVSGTIVFMVSLGLALFTKKKQALHDFLARTVVIRPEGEMIFRNHDDYLRANGVFEDNNDGR